MRPVEGRTVEKNEKFCSTRQQAVCDKRKPVPKTNRSHQTPASTMKTLLTISLCSLALALSSFAQSHAAQQAPPAAGTGPGAASQKTHATNCAQGQAAPLGKPAAQHPAAPGQPAATGQPAAAGQPGAPGAVTSPAAPAGAESPGGAAARGA